MTAREWEREYAENTRRLRDFNQGIACRGSNC
jgi:hypothetical protein